MKRRRLFVVAGVAAIVLIAVLIVMSLANRKTVTVRDGEVVLCTYGEIVSDTTEEIEVLANKVGDHGVKTRTITCDLHKKLAALYGEAQAALAKGDLEAASKALAGVLKLDPSYGNARSLLTEIEAGKTPATDTTAPSRPGGTDLPTDGDQSETPGEEVPTGPSVNLAIYMPDRVTGFVGQLLIVDPFVLTRDYLPETPGPITKLVIVAEQFKDAESAKAALSNRIKHAYPVKPADLEVGGKSAYFGAKGTVAAVAFVDGAVLVVVEAGSTSGDGASFKATVVGIAGEIIP